MIAKIGDLVELRKKELKQLNIILNEAISREMQILDDTIGQLAINNERLSSGLDLAKKDLSYVHALMSQDSGQRAAMQSKLKEQLAKIESQKDSLEKLLESLFNESIVLDDHKLEPVK